jgi:hypothetical protein
VAARFTEDLPQFMALIQEPMQMVSNFVTYIAPEVATKCYDVVVNCTKPELIASLFLVNITSTYAPNSTAITTTLTSYTTDNASVDFGWTTAASTFGNYDYNAEDEHYYLESFPFTDLPIFKRELDDLVYNFDNLNETLYDAANGTFDREDFVDNVTNILQNFTTTFDSTTYTTEMITKAFEEFEKDFKVEEEEICYETICEFVDLYKGTTEPSPTTETDFVENRTETTDFRTTTDGAIDVTTNDATGSSYQ